MNGHRVLPALLSVALGFAPVLSAQSAPLRGPQIGSGATAATQANDLLSLASANQRRISALAYLSAHPLSVTTHPLPASTLLPATLPRGAAMTPNEHRPECPMLVIKPSVTNDSMPAWRFYSPKVEPMPVAAPLCVNPASAKP